MIHLETVNEKTFTKIVKMKVGPEQEKFVASNVYSLAQAWLYYPCARPFAIMNDDVPVGFLMIDWDEDERTAGIWRLMIDSQQQHKGFGHAAVLAVVEYIKAADKFDLIYLDYVPDNRGARNLYYSVGFCENGKVDDGEIVMTMPLNDTPKVGITIADEDDLEEIKEFLENENTKENILLENFCDFDKLVKDINNKAIFRLTIYGDLIGLSNGFDTFISHKHKKYYEEALEKIKIKTSNH